MSEVENKKYLTVNETAKRLSLSLASLAKRRQERKAPPFYKFGRSIRYALTDIEEYEQQARREASPF